ncbi:hypothetical protein K1719_023223 [Acacia pycnantha]|nr:hypothetical protein K1719_023223 [Acacia pycnantha]
MRTFTSTTTTALTGFLKPAPPSSPLPFSCYQSKESLSSVWISTQTSLLHAIVLPNPSSLWLLISPIFVKTLTGKRQHVSPIKKMETRLGEINANANMLEVEESLKITAEQVGTARKLV